MTPQWRRLASVVLGLAVVASTSSGPPAVAKPADTGDKPVPTSQAYTSRTTVGFWEGGISPDCLQGGCPRGQYPKGTWAALRKTDAFLNVGLTYRVDYGPGATKKDGLALIRRAQQEKVEVTAWLLADSSHGTFAAEGNAAEMRRAVKAFAAWKRRHRLQIDDVVLDLELSTAPPTDPSQVRAPADPSRQCRAIASYRRTIALAHRHDLVIHGSPVPFAVDDLLDGNQALADSLDLAPVLPEYDQLFVQVYRTYSDAGPDYLVTYLRQIQKLFGAAGEVTLGDTTMAAPYETAEPLIRDVRLMAALGATSVPVFNLSGSLSKYGVSGIRRIARAGRRPLGAAQVRALSSPTPTTTATRGFFTALNAAANATNPSPNSYPTTCS